jgi:cytochrome P450
METETSTTSPPLVIYTLLALVAASLLFFLRHARAGKNPAPASKGHQPQLPPGPPALVFLAKFLTLRRSIFDLGPLLRDLHARHGPVISVRIFRTLVFVADRRLAHRALVQGGATFADRPPLVDPGRLFTAGARDVSGSPYGPYWRLLRRNLAAEALHPARVGLFAPARRRVCDALVDDLLLRARAGGAAVEVRPLFRRALFELLVYMSLGASSLSAAALDEIEDLQLRLLRSFTSFPVFAFFPALTKKLFSKRWAAYVALHRRQQEVFLPLIRARAGGARRADADDPPCYADSLLALRVADEGDRRARSRTPSWSASARSSSTPARTRR